MKFGRKNKKNQNSKKKKKKKSTMKLLETLGKVRDQREGTRAIVRRGGVASWEKTIKEERHVGVGVLKKR